MKRTNNGVYIGLNIGTSSVGYAVTDRNYNLLRFHGNDAWGTVVFDPGKTNEERRMFRTARKNHRRAKQRVQWLQEIFAKEIATVDEKFFIRLNESFRFRDETGDEYIFFNDEDYTDVDYMEQYPTIHHLIVELMNNKKPHDVRKVYLACAWLLKHRGHFYSNLSVDMMDTLTDINTVYKDYMTYFESNGYSAPWGAVGTEEFGKILLKKAGVKEKETLLVDLLLDGKKPRKDITEEFPFNLSCIIKLLAGGSCKVKDLFGNEEYTDLGSVTLDMDDENFDKLLAGIEEGSDLLVKMRALSEWSILSSFMDKQHGVDTISAAKVAIYEQHRDDLKTLKYFIHKYAPEKYKELFRLPESNSYCAYVGHINRSLRKDLKKKTNIHDFLDNLKRIIVKIDPDDSDKAVYNDMLRRIELYMFLPKQVSTDNRVIPHQLYEYELRKILDNAVTYLPFLRENHDGLTEAEKIIKIFLYKIPYYVGPLNSTSENAWVVRKEGKITPWNFEQMVDEDASEAAFMKKLTGQCTYVPGESVLPMDSLCYQRFMVLNEINTLKIDECKISVKAKQGIYNDLFKKKKKVSRYDIVKYLISNGYIDDVEKEKISGVDITIKSKLSSYYAFRHFLENGKLTEEDVERIIERSAYAEEKKRLRRWVRKEYPDLDEEDVQYIGRIKINGFGRLSRRFLTEIEGANKETGEINTILQMMWNENLNLNEVLSSRFTFAEVLDANRFNYYVEHKMSLEDILDELYVSNAVKRPIYRSLAIIKDIEKAFGEPDKVFIGTTRGSNFGGRSVSRKKQILDCYSKCKNSELKGRVKELKSILDSLGDEADSKLRSDRLFLYFMQLGKCAYTGQSIDYKKFCSGSQEYNIDHIYPLSYSKDDSVTSNKVLVMRRINRDKNQSYPLPETIQEKMIGLWVAWLEAGAITDEKYKRLVRCTPLSDNEKMGFINRQIVETGQSTKTMVTLLKNRYNHTGIEVVGIKPSLVSDFRHEFDLPKSLLYNDNHNATDAFLNVVAGNVYTMKFFKPFFNVRENYSIKTRVIFTHPVICLNETVWNGEDNLSKVVKTARKNTAHFVKYSAIKNGALFDQNPLKAGADLVPLKKGLSTEKYGGYSSAKVAFFIPVKYTAGKKEDIIIIAVKTMYSKRFLEDPKYAEHYARESLDTLISKRIESISFPMGMRPWKPGVMLSCDGFRFIVTGSSSKGKCLILQPVMQFVSDQKWVGYLKNVEKFVGKEKNGLKMPYNPEYDRVTCEQNKELYEVYINKLRDSIYSKRINAPLSILENGKESFDRLEIMEQCKTILTIHQIFGRNSVGCDLRAIGGNKYTASTGGLSSAISNWKKKYKDVRIIDQSPAGLWERKSVNLLDLI